MCATFDLIDILQSAKIDLNKLYPGNKGTIKLTELSDFDITCSQDFCFLAFVISIETEIKKLFHEYTIQASTTISDTNFKSCSSFGFVLHDLKFNPFHIDLLKDIQDKADVLIFFNAKQLQAILANDIFVHCEDYIPLAQSRHVYNLVSDRLSTLEGKKFAVTIGKYSVLAFADVTVSTERLDLYQGFTGNARTILTATVSLMSKDADITEEVDFIYDSVFAYYPKPGLFGSVELLRFTRESRYEEDSELEKYDSDLFKNNIVMRRIFESGFEGQ